MLNAGGGRVPGLHGWSAGEQQPLEKPARLLGREARVAGRQRSAGGIVGSRHEIVLQVDRHLTGDLSQAMIRAAAVVGSLGQDRTGRAHGARGVIGATQGLLVHLTHAAATRRRAARDPERLGYTGVTADGHCQQISLPLAHGPVGDSVAVEAVPCMAQLVIDHVADLSRVAARAVAVEDDEVVAVGEGIAAAVGVGEHGDLVKVGIVPFGQKLPSAVRVEESRSIRGR